MYVHILVGMISTTERCTPSIIDNTQILYLPFHLKSGLTLQCSLEVFEQCSDIFNVLEKDVCNCLRVLPSSVHDLVRKTKIWINVTYAYGTYDNPKILKHTNTHHYERWLMCIHDRPEKVLGIEIYNCFEYLENRHHWNGCGMLLHEFCHLIHQIVLPHGLDNIYVKNMYDIAMRSQKYDEVIRRDWAYLSCDKDAAYGTINHKEFFAEISVTFLSRGYRKLDIINGNADNVIMDMDVLSPPFHSPQILERQNDTNRASPENNSKNFFTQYLMDVGKLINNHQCHHCNKFFPFTRRQLEAFDPDTYEEILYIWTFVGNWKDPNKRKFINCPTTWLSCCWGDGQEKINKFHEPLLDKADDIISDQDESVDTHSDGEYMNEVQDTVVL